MDEMAFEMHQNPPPERPRFHPPLPQGANPSTRCPYATPNMSYTGPYHGGLLPVGHAHELLSSDPLMPQYRPQWMQLPVPHPHHSHNPHHQHQLHLGHQHPMGHMAFSVSVHQVQPGSGPSVPPLHSALPPHLLHAGVPLEPLVDAAVSSSTRQRAATASPTFPMARRASQNNDQGMGSVPTAQAQLGQFRFPDGDQDFYANDPWFATPQTQEAQQPQQGRPAGGNQEHPHGQQTSQAQAMQGPLQQAPAPTPAPATATGTAPAPAPAPTPTPAQAQTSRAEVVNGSSAEASSSRLPPSALSETYAGPLAVPFAMEPSPDAASGDGSDQQATVFGSSPTASTTPPNSLNPTSGPDRRGFERRRAVGILRHRRSGSGSTAGGPVLGSSSGSDDDQDPDTPLPTRPRSLYEHLFSEERVRAQQLLRGSVVSRVVASKKAIESLESVDIASLDDGERMCIICYNDFGKPTPEGINEAPLRLPKCRHIFGDHCIKKWFTESDSCPYCRDKVPSERQCRTTSRALHQFMQVHQYASMRDTPMPPAASARNGSRYGASTGERRAPPDANEENRRRTRRRHASFRPSSTSTSASTSTSMPTAPSNNLVVSSTNGIVPNGRPNSYAGANSSQAPPPYLAALQPQHPAQLLPQLQYQPSPLVAFNSSQRMYCMPPAYMPQMPNFQQSGIQEPAAAYPGPPSANEEAHLYYGQSMYAGSGNTQRFPTMQPLRPMGFNGAHQSFWAQPPPPPPPPPPPASGEPNSSCPQVLPPPFATTMAETRPIFYAPFSHQIPPLATNVPAQPETIPVSSGMQMQGPPAAPTLSAPLPRMQGLGAVPGLDPYTASRPGHDQ